MEVKTVDFFALQNAEVFQVAKSFWNAVRGVGAETLNLVQIWEEEYIPVYQEMDRILKPLQGSLLTDELVELDRKRDSVYRGMKYAVKAMLHDVSAAKVKAAQNVTKLINQYGNVPKDNYGKESSLIYNLIQELNTKFTADVATLGLSSWLTELDKANKEFDNLYTQRAETTGAEKPEIAMYELRPKFYAVYRKCIKMIEAGSVFTNEEVYITFIKTWNEIIDKWRIVLAKREGNADEETEDKS